MQITSAGIPSRRKPHRPASQREHGSHDWLHNGLKHPPLLHTLIGRFQHYYKMRQNSSITGISVKLCWLVRPYCLLPSGVTGETMFAISIMASTPSCAAVTLPLAPASSARAHAKETQCFPGFIRHYFSLGLLRSPRLL